MTVSQRLLQTGAATVGLVEIASIMVGRAAAETSSLTWLLPRSAFDNLNNTSLGGDPTVCQSAFNQGTTWFSTNYEGSGPSTKNPIPYGYSGIGVLKFEAYQNGATGLVDAISAGLPAWVTAVQYDSESWSQTPEIEQGAWLYNSYPQTSYAQQFCDTAHQQHLTIVLSPGNDLCNSNTNSAYPNSAPQYPLNPGETDYDAYVRYDLASAAQYLSAGDIYEYQTQILELDPTKYQSDTSQVAGQVAAVSSGVTVLAGIGRTGSTWDGGTSAQLLAAAQSVSGIVSGYWPNVDANASRVQPMIGLLQGLGY